MESHAEIKDKCDGLETRLDEIAADIRDLPFDYRLVDRYTTIDEEMNEIQEWYEKSKEMIQRYLNEREDVENRPQQLDIHLKTLNNEVQNLKLQAFSRGQREGSYSRLYDSQHL